MKKFLILASILFSCLFSNAQGVICRVHNSTSTFESRLDTAIAHSVNGDVLYLPGGLVASSNPVIINKRLTIVGAGYHPDSSKATLPSTCLFDIQMEAGADSTLLTGIYCSGELDINTSNITISRCNLNYIYTIPNASNITILENIIRNSLNGHLNTNFFASKNIIYGQITGFQSALFVNNVMLYDGFNQLLVVVINCTFNNNIFTNSTGMGSFTGNLFNNNLLVCNNSSLQGNGNIINIPIGNIFTNYIPSSVWSSSQNFHLKVGCPGINAGTDGTDLGVYGTINPFKDGGIPFNPHYQSIVIGSQTNSSGKLPINIKVKAQTN